LVAINLKKEIKMRKYFIIILALLTISLSAYAHAAEKISLVVPFAAGGPGDRLARTIQSQLNNDRYQFIIEYMPGAGGVVAANNIAKIKDKTVFVLMGNAINTAIVQGSAQYTYDDFVTVKHLGEDRLFLIVKNDGVINTWEDFVQQSKNKFMPYGTGGLGSANHISAAIVSNNNPNHTPIHYRGSGELIGKVISGEISWALDSGVTLDQHVQSGSVKILTVFGDTRLSQRPLIPSTKELGIDSFSYHRWIVLLANRHSDVEVVNYVHRQLSKPENIKQIEQLNWQQKTINDTSNFLQDQENILRRFFKQIQLGRY
jgi:tripartite-type tricarboxylate transporter receptor subunit TctC